MGQIPKTYSIMNSSSRSGGNPGKPFGKTSSYSHVIDVRSILGPQYLQLAIIQ